jgi:murein DD-endopeptidase MepM/ murein hydrolase activator NlpD
MNDTAVNILQRHQEGFHPVVSFDPTKDKLLRLDLTAENTELTEGVFNDITTFTHYINDKLAAANCRYGIGGYGEHRKLYSRSNVFDATDGEEPRRLHLGVDIWGKQYTAVMAPIDGVVHSFAFNNQQGDYGATIILTHRIDGFTFYTLYGHLSLNSLKDKQEGQRIEKGDVFAEFGIPIENGHWPPHLHFQIILDIADWKGDYPGVSKYSEKETYLLNCPDPDIILQLNRYLY